MVLGTCVPQQVVKLKTVTVSKTGDISVGVEMVYTNTHQRGGRCERFILDFIYMFLLYINLHVTYTYITFIIYMVEKATENTSIPSSKNTKH